MRTFLLCNSNQTVIDDITMWVQNYLRYDVSSEIYFQFSIFDYKHLDKIKDGSLILIKEDATDEGTYFVIKKVDHTENYYEVYAYQKTLGYIDRNRQPKEYDIVLCKPDKTPIAYLDEAMEFEYKPHFSSVDEIEFKIPYHIMFNHVAEINPNWDLIKGDYLILLDGEQYFTIDKPKIESNGDEEYKAIHGYSLEYTLGKKIVRKYNNMESTSELALKCYLETIPEGMLLEDYPILNYFSTLTSWSFGYVDPVVAERTRVFQIEEKTLLDVSYEIQKTFKCFFKYDTINQVIDVYDINSGDVNIDRGLYITDANYIKAFEEEIDHDEVVTRLYPYGQANLSIHDADENLTGQPYIENLGFYRVPEYMSEGLLKALDDYDILLESKESEFQTTLNEINILLDTLYSTPELYQGVEVFGLYGKLAKAQEILEIKEQDIDNAIAQGDRTENDLTTLNSERDNAQLEVDNIQAEIDSIESQLEVKRGELTTLQNTISKDNNFTTEQIVELDYFIREKTWTDTNYFNANELYNDAVEKMYKLSQPPITFSIDLVDFLRIVVCQHDWDKLKLGDIVHIQYDKFGVDIQVRLISFSHNPESGNLQLNFSNTDSIDDPAVYLNEVLKDATSTSTTVNLAKYKWSENEDNISHINQVINSEWDSAKRKIVAGSNQQVKIDERGIGLTSTLNPDRQLRMINDVIAMTTNGWSTAKLAITPEGIYADRLMGNMIAGSQMVISHENSIINIDGNGITMKGASLSIEGGLTKEHVNTDLYNRWDSIMADNKITMVESMQLQLQLERVKAEGSTIEGQCNNYNWYRTGSKNEEVLLNTYLVELENFEKYLNGGWINQPSTSYPLTITGDIIISDGTESTTYPFSRTQLHTFLNNIEGYKLNVQNTLSDAKDSDIQTDINSLDTAITNAFSDDYITTVEARELKLAYYKLNAENSDTTNGNLSQIATDIGVSSTHINNYENRITALKTELNKWVKFDDGSGYTGNYPIKISDVNTTGRTDIKTAFENVEKARTLLMNKINAKQEDNTSNLVSNARTFFQRKNWKYEGDWNIPSTGVGHNFTFDPIPQNYLLQDASGNSFIELKVNQYDLEQSIDILVGTQSQIDGGTAHKLVDGTGKSNYTGWLSWKIPTSALSTTENNIVRIFHDGGTADWGHIYNVEIEFDYKGYSEWYTNTKVHQDIQDFKENVVDVRFAELQSQVDGSITTWFYDGVPETSTEPYISWKATDDQTTLDNGDGVEVTTERDKHIGDLYYDNLTGYAYRFVYENLDDIEGKEYGWVKIVDADLVKALEDASTAQDTADRKRTIFVATPYTPYQVGDMWVKSETDAQGNSVAGDLYVCNTEKLSGSYDSTHWEIATKYTDDAYAIDKFNTMMADNKVTRSESESMKQMLKQIQAERYKLVDTTNGVAVLIYNALSSDTDHDRSVEMTSLDTKINNYRNEVADLEEVMSFIIDQPNKADGTSAYPVNIGYTHTYADSTTVAITRENVSTLMTNIADYKVDLEDYIGKIRKKDNELLTDDRTNALQTELNKLSDDGYITLTESKSLENLYNQLMENKSNLLTTSVDLGFDTTGSEGKTHYDEYVTYFGTSTTEGTLVTEIKKWVVIDTATQTEKTYPLVMGSTDAEKTTARETLKDTLIVSSQKKTALINKIDEVQVGNRLNDLQTTMNEAFSDNKITYIEAQNIKLSYDQLDAEDDDLISEGNSLSLDTVWYTTDKPVETYSTAITNLYNNIVKKILYKSDGITAYIDSDYPLSMGSTTSDELPVDFRTSMQTHFESVQGAKSKLVNSITSVREVQAREDAKTHGESYTDNEIETKTGNLVNNTTKSGTLDKWVGSATVVNKDFFGQTVPVQQVVTSDSVAIYSDTFEVDPSKAYEVTIWTMADIDNGSEYFGLYGYNESDTNIGVDLVNISNGTLNSSASTNPYFWSSGQTFPLNTWIRRTAYIVPTGTSNKECQYLGYNVDRCARMLPNTKTIKIRWLNYYNDSVTKTMWVANPKVVEIPFDSVAHGVRDDKSYQGVTLDVDNGLTVSDSNTTMVARLNARDGIIIGTHANDGSWATKPFEVTTSGILTTNSMTAKDIVINGGKLKAIINGTETSLIDLDSQTIDFTKFNKIKGTNLDLKGSLTIQNNDATPQTTFSIDANGNVTVRGTIHMDSSSTITWGTDNKPDYTDIGGTKPPSNANYYSDGYAVDAWESAYTAYQSTSIGNNYVFTGYIDADYIVAGKIDADHIATDIAQVNDNLQLGSTSNDGSITFKSGAIIDTSVGVAGIRISCSQFTVDDGNIMLGSSSGSYTTDFYGTVDFSGASSISWGSHAPTAVFG